ncbi:hypothetical protein C0J52_09652 [Blattella germanica]|nr:hypothetical protein C0J52_09652 [Blattella germanica]
MDDKLLITKDYEDIEYMTWKLVEEYEKWGLNINLKKTNYMAIGTDSKYLILEEGKGIINHCEEYIYLGMKIKNTGFCNVLITISAPCLVGQRYKALIITVVISFRAASSSCRPSFRTTVKQPVLQPESQQCVTSTHLQELDPFYGGSHLPQLERKYEKLVP